MDYVKLIKGAQVLINTGHHEAAEFMISKVAEAMDVEAASVEWAAKAGNKVTYYFGRPTEDFLSPDLTLFNERGQEPYQTVLGWMALAYSTELHRWLQSDCVLHETQRLGFLAVRDAPSDERRSSYPHSNAIKVRGGKYLAEYGIDYVNAYPIEVLARLCKEEFGK